MPLDLNHVAADPTITDQELVIACATLLAALRTRGIVRTKNVVGDLGESYAVTFYNQINRRGGLTRLPTNSTDIDATDSQGGKYAVKAASPKSARTSAFHILEEHPSDSSLFDYVILVRLNELLQIVSIYEFSWETFWERKKWSKRQKAWFLPITKAVLQAGTALFPEVL